MWTPARAGADGSRSPMTNKKIGYEINTSRDWRWPEKSLSSAQGNVGWSTKDFVLEQGQARPRTHNGGAMTVENRREKGWGWQTTDFRFLLISFSICRFLRSFSPVFQPPLSPETLPPALVNRGSNFYAGSLVKVGKCKHRGVHRATGQGQARGQLRMRIQIRRFGYRYRVTDRQSKDREQVAEG